LPGLVRLCFCSAPGLRSLLTLVSFSVLSAFIVSHHAKAQTDNKCKESVSLWMPSPQSGGNDHVTKWVKPINYGIVEPIDYGMAGGADDAKAAELTMQTLRFFAHESGLSIEPNMNSPLDLFIEVAPDISTFGPRILGYIEKSLQDSLSKKGLGTQIKLDPAQWEPRFRNMPPKCVGIGLNLRGVIERAHVVIQSDQSLPCIEVGLGERFGLANIRKYYVDHAGSVPEEVVSTALRTLYDKRIRPGLDATGAQERLGEICGSI
jgi:hypothetical protein